MLVEMMSYEGTEVPVSKSQESIRKLIYAHKGTGLMLVSRPPAEGFEAFIDIEKTPYHIRIMAQCKDVSKDRWGTKKTATAQRNATEKEERRVWRVLYWYLKAIFEAADSGVVDVRNVIMPYVVLKDGRTLSDHIQPRMSQLMTMDTSRLLGGPPDAR
jgi:hypothetical protein